MHTRSHQFFFLIFMGIHILHASERGAKITISRAAISFPDASIIKASIERNVTLRYFSETGICEKIANHFARKPFVQDGILVDVAKLLSIYIADKTITEESFRLRSKIARLLEECAQHNAPSDSDKENIPPQAHNNQKVPTPSRMIRSLPLDSFAEGRRQNLAAIQPAPPQPVVDIAHDFLIKDNHSHLLWSPTLPTITENTQAEEALEEAEYRAHNAIIEIPELPLVRVIHLEGRPAKKGPWYPTLAHIVDIPHDEDDIVS